MLLAFVIWSTISLCIANPLHKYPYVFLLDVGNEELQKTNTEQLRVSIPGGSLSMKYPALGEGDPISHVRVSGIDFGTDLKVNIIGGGPGYKYVVLMFIGNPGVTYDAVVTLETLPTPPTDTEKSFTTKVNEIANINKIASTKNLVSKPYEVSDSESDVNDQDEMQDDSKNMKQYTKKSKEVTQSTSTVYNYAKNGIANSDEDEESENVSAENNDDDDYNDNDSTDEASEEKNIFSKYNEGQVFSNEETNSESSNEREHEVSDEHEDENEEQSVKAKLYGGNNYDQFRDTSRAERYMYNVNLNNEDNAKPDDMYDRYEDPKPRIGLGFRIYPQSFISNDQYQEDSANKKEDPVKFDNDEAVQNYFKFKDGSNNIDADYLVAEY